MSEIASVKVRIAESFIDEIEKLRRLGAWKGSKPSQFLGYILRSAWTNTRKIYYRLKPGKNTSH